MNSVQDMSKYILDKVKEGSIDEEMAYSLLTTLNNKEIEYSDDIAIIGVAVRLPGADNVDEFWNNLKEEVNSIDYITQKRYDGSLPYIIAVDKIGSSNNSSSINKVVKAGYINDIESFDPGFFNISNQEAKRLEPMQRMVLEISHDTLEDAGYGGNKTYGSRTGVFIGSDFTYRMNLGMFEPDEILSSVGSWSSIIASRVSYTYDFKGPCIVLDTACSSGIVAVHEACKAIKKNECSTALVGGINIFGKPIMYDESGLSEVENDNGELIVFDRNSNGTIWGEGIGMVLLKPLKKALEDKDNIYAVIKGSTLNNDGTSNGITSPNAEAQTDVIIRAWKESKIKPEQVSYIEAHGTGTIVGDPIEVKGIENAFEKYTNKKQFCGVGTVKTNIGHIVGASGIASLIKVALCLKNKILVATLNFNEPNPYINFSNSSLYVVDKTQKWENENGVRVAGINSFGFSGTNCHMVLAEGPEINEKVEGDIKKPYIFTLSAKNEKVLKNYVKNYISYLKDTDLPFKDIIYTASTGRGHYNFRLAVISESIEDLYEKLLLIKKSGLRSFEEKNIYYSKAKVSKNEDDICKDLVEKLVEFTYDTDKYLDICVDISKEYIKGKKINFEKLFEEDSVRKVRIPVYPLERKVVKFAEHIMENDKKRNTVVYEENMHPLINDCLVKSYDENIYITTFNTKNQWTLHEHRITDSYVLPGTAYLEMARVVGSHFYEKDEIELRNFKFLSTLIVKEEDSVEVQTIIRKVEDHLKITIVSKEEDCDNYIADEWTVHVEGEIYSLKSENKKMNIHQLKNRFSKNQQSIKLSDVSLDFYNLGGRWNNLCSTSVDNGESLITLRLPEEFLEDLDIFKVHPSMIDNAMNGLMSYIIKESGGHLYIPLEYTKIAFYRPMPRDVYSFMHNFRNFKKDSEIITYDVIIMDESGNIIAEAIDYKIKRVNDVNAVLNRKKRMNRIYHYFGWKNEEISESNKENSNEYDVLLIKDEKGISDDIGGKFKEKGHNVYEIEINKECREVYKDENKFVVNNSKESYIEILKEVYTGQAIKILHSSSIVNKKKYDEFEETNVRIEKGVMSLLHLSQAIMECKIQGDLILLTDYASMVDEKEPYINAEGNALFGLGKTIQQEYEKLKVRCIDIDENISTEKLFRELKNTENFYDTAYRENRYIKEFKSVDVRRVDDSNIEIKNNGAYIITGGMGGIGTEIAKYLASKNKVNIVLMNRTKLPNKEEWDEILAKKENNNLITKINRVLDIESKGAIVDIMSCDISDYDRMKLIIENIKEKYGKINGVIHGAGIAGEGLLEMKSDNTFKNVLNPKVKGTKCIDMLTRDENLDFFIILSSIATLTGGIGIGDYTAANSYLDSYASNMKYMKVINWPFWKETGMAVDGNFLENSEKSAFKVITNEEAIDAFNIILNKNIKSVYIGRINYTSIVLKNYNNLPFMFTKNVLSRIENSNKGLQVNLIGRDGNFTETEHILAAIWGVVFDLEEVLVDDNFYELGGNSLLSIKIENEIEKKFNITLDENNIIQTYDTIEKLGEYIDRVVTETNL
ncbi:SDR family NAD(P)-dependent oxidoreductase [Clostridium botulinum]|nr:SDR family NAD(P)-dependent oxidoreductase [Clostridium botulinum]